MLRLKFPTDEIVQLYLSGQSEKAVAKYFRTNQGVIQRRLRDAGVKRRGLSEAALLTWSQMSPEARFHKLEVTHKANRGKHEPRDKLWRINPTERELYFISLIRKYNWPLTYCGSGGIVINGHNPDFIHKTQKKVLEIYSGGNKHPEKALKYAKCGFQCLHLAMDQTSEESKVRMVEQFLAS